MDKIRILAIVLIFMSSGIADMEAAASHVHVSRTAGPGTFQNAEELRNDRTARWQEVHRRDSLHLAEIRSRMDSIRTRRPTVALVLSGGGAKGAAHIGVIEYLESIGMPIDMVLGTSMGGLVGGIYAMGYPVHELDSIVRAMDWELALSDKIPREYISYAEKKYKEKYLLSFPFYYKKEYYLERKADEMKFSDTDDSGLDGVQRHEDKISLGADQDDSRSIIKDNLLGSLPSGYVFGQNVQNIFSSLSVGYQDSLDFNDLPIPFACVATDLVSGRAKIWNEGKITTALRSTMSIPGIFAPVKIDGMVLVDGGMRDNYPTALARQMGADIVIGVDVSSGRKRYDQINNIGDIINAGIDMLGRSVYEENVKIADVNIKPDLEEYNMMSFDTESIDRIIHQGYVAAYRNEAQLMNIKQRVGGDTLVLHNRKAVDINVDSVLVDCIEIRGVGEKERAILMKRIDIFPGDRVCREDIDDVVAEVFGTQAYDYVTYEMEGSTEPFHLVINCKPGPIHHFGFGVRLDTEEVVSLLLNVSLNAHKLQGSIFDFTGKISTNPYFKFHYTYNSPKSPTVNATASVRWTGMNLLDYTSSRFNLDYLNLRQEVYLSNINWSMFDIQFGLRNDYFNLRSLYSAGGMFGDYNMDQMKNDYISLFLNARADTFDDGYFPTSGYTAGLSYGWTFAGFPYRFNNFHAVHLDAKTVIRAGNVFSFIPSVNFRFLFGNRVPLAYVNCVGGVIPGRYIDQQIPFVGVNNLALARNIATVFRTDFRFRIARNHYVTGIVNYMRDCNDFSTYTHGPGIFGAGVEYAFDTVLGPLMADIHWSSLTQKVGFYIGFGYYF